ncbi:NAD(P)/FAD-dependent oxidoreductase [Gymnodinialimonas ceratoperidinii]|uniref:FAD-dependent oxidoreductase n=1 Tax=Gymnodinialimonas ceratoperidinii TaxID=2856823 RepID=A0A8F6YBR9_9RHOB|nr:FAD-dependent oxidoreductase [Gymnodinialimonas ceratoperidinii]QXT40431.1 FAD-dependent oxidoreductase [Gymnodinialimonas ceratoperidinii]
MDHPITILGAGAVGLCCALSLAERGHAVRLIDRQEPGRETSFGNAGVISPWSIIPQSMPGLLKQIPGLLTDRDKTLRIHARHWPAMVPWGLRFLAQGRVARVREIVDAMEHLCGPSVDLYRRHLQGTGQEHLVQDSFYIHAFRKAEKADITALGYALRGEKGAEMEVVEGGALRELEPGLSEAFKAAILIKGQARALSPGEICDALAAKARGLGVEIIRDEVEALQQGETGWSVRCKGDSYEAARVVIAMGVWSKTLLQGLGMKVPLQAERGYHVEFRNPGVSLNHSVMDVDRKVVLSRMNGGIRIAGQAEFAAIDAPPDPSREAILTDAASDALRGLNTQDGKLWMGQRPSFPDSLPAIGEVPERPGLFTCFGHSHYGLMMAPKSGEVVADLIEDRRSNADLAPYAITRFA